MKLLCGVIFIFLFFSFHSPLFAAKTGDICFKPLPVHAETMMSEKQRKNKSYHKRYKDKLIFQIGDKSVMVSRKEGNVIEGLDPNKKHLLQIKDVDESVVSSFHFSFQKHKTNKLTLSQKAGYGTWQINKRGKNYPKCPWPKYLQPTREDIERVKAETKKKEI